MSIRSSRVLPLNGALVLTLLVGSLALSATTASAQDAITKESAAVVKASFLADLEVMRGEFLGLAQAFPPDKYQRGGRWRVSARCRRS